MGTAVDQNSGTETREYTAVRVTVPLLTTLTCMPSLLVIHLSQIRGIPQERVKQPRDGLPLYTQNLSPDSTDTGMLQEVFASCGNVKSAVVVKGQGGQSTGAAYIHFEDHTSAKVGRASQ